MIQIGDYVLYKQEGVCRVSDLGERSIGGLGAFRYYTLKPISYDGTIYAPAENSEHLRPVLSRQQALSLLERAPQIQPLFCTSKEKKTVIEFCQSLIDPDDCESFLRAMKSIAVRRGSKILSAPEEEVYRRAERCMVEELSVALCLPFPEAKETLERALHA